MTRREVMAGSLASLTTRFAAPRHDSKVKVTLYFDVRVIEEFRIAAQSRNETLEAWIHETLDNAVSDCSVLPGGCRHE